MNEKISQHNYSVKTICIYPIKALGSVNLNTSKLLTEGLEHDRRFMLVDQNGRFLSQRELPQLACFSCSISDNILTVRYNGEAIEIPLIIPNGDPRKVSVWDSNFKAIKSDIEIDNWFSDILGMKVELVALSPSFTRVKRFFKPPYKTSVSFADGYPFLVLGTASMDFLNAKLENPIGYNRFRPNIVINTDIPHVEDTWENISVSNVKLKMINPCARCVVPSIDQETGIKGIEPLKTLSTYRIQSRKVMFGVNAISMKTGKISISDTVNLL